MKNRKIVVVAFTLIAVLLLGVGYAAVTDDLAVIANVKTNLDQITSDFQMDVRFLENSAQIIKDDTRTSESDPNRAHAQIDVTNDPTMDTAVITVTNFTAGDQQVQAVFTIANFSTEFDASVQPELTADFEATGAGEAHDPVFTLDWEWYVNGAGTGSQDAAVLAASADGTTPSTAQILVTITLVEAPDEEHSGVFTLDITATAQ